MKGRQRLALAGACAMTAILAQGAPAHAQVRVFDMGDGGSQIGVSVHDPEGDSAQARAGVLVDEVTSSSPASKAGIKDGDRIVEFDGQQVRSARQFSRIVEETRAGAPVSAVLMREGQRTTVTITPERAPYDDGFRFRLLDRLRPAAPLEPPAAPMAPRAPRPPALVAPAAPFGYLARPAGRRLGATLETLDDQLAAYFGVKEGVLVRSVEDGSAAAKAGLKAGDVITGLNGRQVYEVGDVSRALQRMETDGDVSIEIVRDKKKQELKAKLPNP